MKLFFALALALSVYGQAPAGDATRKSDITVEVHDKAVKLVEVTGGRDRFVASLPEVIEQGKAAMRRQCPDCKPAFFEEWGKRMATRLSIDEFLNVAVRAYETRFNNDEFNELLAVAASQKSEKPVTISQSLQKKITDLMPAIMGEIVGGCTQIGAKLGAEIGTEIEKEHPEYVPTKPKSNKL